MGLWFGSQPKRAVPSDNAIGTKAELTYQELQTAVRHSPVNQLDETGWRVAAHLEWLWVCVSAQVTLYAILPGRGFVQAASILGEDYAGFLNHDGWQPYYRFPDAFHQTCLSHLIRRCKDMIETASAGAARFPQAVMQTLLEGWCSAIALTEEISCMVCRWPRAGSSPTWTGCWQKRFAIPPIGGWQTPAS